MAEQRARSDFRMRAARRTRGTALARTSVVRRCDPEVTTTQGEYHDVCCHTTVTDRICGAGGQRRCGAAPGDRARQPPLAAACGPRVVRTSELQRSPA